MRIEDAVAARVRAFRESMGLTQAELGRALPQSWSRQAVSAAEKGDRAFAVADLADLAAALGVSIADLVGEVGSSGHPLAGVQARVRGIRQQLDDLAAELDALAGGA